MQFLLAGFLGLFKDAVDIAVYMVYEGHLESKERFAIQ